MQFIPFDIVIDTAFWHLLAKRKLQEFKLSEGPFTIPGHYENCYAAGLPSRLTIDFAAFDPDEIGRLPARCFHRPGSLYVLNSVGRFMANLKENAGMRAAGENLVSCITEGRWETQPQLLSPLLLVAFADLKKVIFIYRLDQ